LIRTLEGKYGINSLKLSFLKHVFESLHRYFIYGFDMAKRENTVMLLLNIKNAL